MSTSSPRIVPLGESAVTLSWGDTVSLETNATVLRAAAVIRAAGIEGVTDLVPAYSALSVFYDPLHIDYETMASRLAQLVDTAGSPDAAPSPPREHEIPVYYDGPDLEEVARLTGLPAAEVIARHKAPTYRVFLLGFVPGFAYLGELDGRLVLPRRGTPRKRVAAGSVGLAGAQTAVYPLDTPGGWHLIGRTTVSLFDPARAEPSLFRPGDLVRFVEGHE
jgi:KipI family sensor histidine kinase inhibitor